jgi:hypothetical protein
MSSQPAVQRSQAGPARNGAGAPILSRLERLPYYDVMPGPENLAGVESAALQTFLANAIPWYAVRTPLSASLTATLWILLFTDIAVGGWLFVVLHGSMTCDSLLCAAATLGGHPVLTFVLAVVGGLGLLAVSIPTRGLTQGGLPERLVMSAAALMIFASVVGAVLVSVFLAVVATLIVSLIIGLLVAMLSDS